MTEPIITTAATTSEISIFTTVLRFCASEFQRFVEAAVYQVEHLPNISQAELSDLTNAIFKIGEAIEALERKLGELPKQGVSNAS